MFLAPISTKVAPKVEKIAAKIEKAAAKVEKDAEKKEEVVIEGYLRRDALNATKKASLAKPKSAEYFSPYTSTTLNIRV
ncbi:hypothetical protein HDR58_08530 [bacterium]|nr:hypothetical protein [bacterium]